MDNHGGQRLYITNPADFRGRSDVIRWESLPIEGGSSIHLRFMDSQASEPQGLFLLGSHEMKIADQSGRAMEVWNNTAPAVVEILTSPETTFISFYHVARDGGVRMSHGYRMGMLVEELDSRRFRYSCTNNGVQFDSLIFDIEIIPVE